MRADHRRIGDECGASGQRRRHATGHSWKPSFVAWRDGTGSPYDLLAENVNWTIVGRSDASKSYPSREAFMSEVIRPFNARMRDRLRPTMRNLYADGDTVVIFFDATGVAKNGEA